MTNEVNSYQAPSRIDEFVVYDLPGDIILQARDPKNKNVTRLLSVSKRIGTEDKKTNSIPQDTDLFRQITQLATLSLCSESFYSVKTNHGDLLAYADYTIPTQKLIQNQVPHVLRAKSYQSFRAYGLLGAIKFTAGYYLVLVKKRRLKAVLGHRKLYGVDLICLVPCFHTDHGLSQLETDYKSLFESFLEPICSSFFCSYEWDLTRTVQQQVKDATSESNFFAYCDMRFVYNIFLLRPFPTLDCPFTDWFIPIIQGSIETSEFSLGLRKLTFIVIARRSRYNAGPRFFRRGISQEGYVANEVECEQILCDSLLFKAHDPECSLIDPQTLLMGVASFIMIRGSIPLFWGHESFVSIRPKIHFFADLDPHYKKTLVHFEDLFSRYGKPVTILNMAKSIKQSEPEAVLSSSYRSAVETILSNAKSRNETSESDWSNQTNVAKANKGEKSFNRLETSEFRQETSKTLYTEDIIFEDFDWAYWEKQQGFHKALPIFFETAKELVSKHAFYVETFTNDSDWTAVPETAMPRLYQRGIIRINCIDCLDRTNLGMFALGQEALRLSLIYMGCLRGKDSSSSLTEIIRGTKVPTEILQSVSEVWGLVGDALALSYAGSPALHRPCIEQWLPSVPPASYPYLFSHCWHKPFLESGEQTHFNKNSLCNTLNATPELNDASIGNKWALWHDLMDLYAYEPDDIETFWYAKKRSNVTIAVKRYINNMFNDLDRQRGTDLLLGKFIPSLHRPSIWEMWQIKDGKKVSKQLSEHGQQMQMKYLNSLKSVAQEDEQKSSRNKMNDTSLIIKPLALFKPCFCFAVCETNQYGLARYVADPESETELPSINVDDILFIRQLL